MLSTLLLALSSPAVASPAECDLAEEDFLDEIGHSGRRHNLIGVRGETAFSGCGDLVQYTGSGGIVSNLDSGDTKWLENLFSVKNVCLFHFQRILEELKGICWDLE